MLTLSVLLRKIKSLMFLVVNRWGPDFILPIFFVPLAVLFRLIALCFDLKLVRLHSFKIGHLAANTDRLMCRERKKTDLSKLLIFVDNADVSNEELLKKWGELGKLVPRWFFRPLFLANRALPFETRFEFDLRFSSDRDTEHLFDETPPQIVFSKEERRKADHVLLPLTDGRPIVCVIFRDSGYYDARLGRASDRMDDYRNSDIDTFKEAAEWLVACGYVVFRMGRNSNQTFDVQNRYIIDYANSEIQSQFLDIYLPSICSFVVSTSTGWDSLAKTFRKPVLFLNFCPIH